ncbi:hypothetical protein DFH07DRAFT_772362 [Mycena maculata]|uniref:Uncharacterized protein n=1 Tax=Mycena maculata TaxID=230809 RepID=A0AAD7J8X7_9AGAR|nr:hypothetical protein DFH07DRAFT_772362 [Mycena maculata]
MGLEIYSWEKVQQVVLELHGAITSIYGFRQTSVQQHWRTCLGSTIGGGMFGFFSMRMAENMKEGQIHRDAFNTFDAALRETAAEMVEGWKEWVTEWESRQYTHGADSLFEMKEKGA